MKTSIFTTCTATWLLCWSCLWLSCSPRNEPSTVQIYEDYILVAHSTDNYANGYLHGQKLKDIIKDQIGSWQQNMSQELGLSQAAMEDIVYDKTNFIRAIDQYAPDLLEEIYGIADGAGLDRKLVLCYNLGEEIYNYQNQPTERCSNLAVKSKEQNMLVYNQDLPFFLHGINKPVVLRRPNELVFTLPGMLALSGVSKTVAVSCNALPMLKMNKAGLPLSFAIRQLLSQASLKDGQNYLENTPLAIPQNFLLAAPEGIIGLEVSENVVESYSTDATKYLYHTNFPVLNQDYKYAAYQAPSCQRYQAIENFLNDRNEINDLATNRLESLFDKPPLHNDETYLRFIVSFPTKAQAFPTIQLINPKRNNTTIAITF